MDTPAHMVPGETHREYLGDTVYASFDGWNIWLRTGDGNNQAVALEPPVFRALVEYQKRLYASFNKGDSSDQSAER